MTKEQFDESKYWELYEQTLKAIRSDFPKMNFMDLEGIAGDAVVDMMRANYPHASHCIRTAKTRCINLANSSENNCERLDESECSTDPTDFIAAEQELERLDNETRTALVLEAYGISQEESARMMGVSKNTVNSRLSAFRKRDDAYMGMLMWVDAWYVWYKDSRRTRIMPEGYSSPLSEEYFDMELAKTIYRADAVMDSIVKTARDRRLSVSEVEDVMKRRYNDGRFYAFATTVNGRLRHVTKQEAESIHRKTIKGIDTACEKMRSELHT